MQQIYQQNVNVFYLVALHQAQVRNQQAQDTSVSITRGARTVKGRLPAVQDGEELCAAMEISDWCNETGDAKGHV
jgi:hypothetical protein